MSTKWELQENSTGTLKVTVEGKVWEDAQTKAFNKLATKLALPGFRAGKVPTTMAKKHISEQEIQYEAIDYVASDALKEGIKEHDLQIIAQPQLGIDGISEKQIELTFTIQVKPEVTLGAYTKLGVKKEKVSVTETEIKKQMTELQEKFAEMEIKEKGAVKKGDVATIDFEGFLDGVAFDGGKGENYPLGIGSNSFIPGFEDQIIGMKLNETKDIQVTFPEEYQEPTLAGKEVTFKVTVNEVKVKKLPTFDEELLKMAKIEGVNTVEEYKAFAKSELEASKTKQAEDNFANDCLTKLVDGATVSIPQVMIDEETDQLVEDFKQRLAQQGFPYEQFIQMTGQTDEQVREQMATDATNKVKLRLVLEAVAEKEKIEVSDSEIDEEFKRIADLYKMEVDKVKSLISSDSIAYDLRLRAAIELAKK